LPVCIDKNSREQVRADLQRYKQYQLLSMRVFWRSDDSDNWRPSKRGFALRVDALPELIQGLLLIQAAAVARGWLTDTEPPQPTSTKETPKGHSIACGTNTRGRAGASAPNTGSNNGNTTNGDN
jgi:hypothetical protein